MSAEQISELVQRARQHVRKKELAQAILFYEEALVLSPESVQLHEATGTLYFATRENDKAAEHFLRAAELDPQNGRAMINLGAVYNRQGRHKEAAEILRRGIARTKSSLGFYNLGIAQKKLGQVSMAVSAYREAIRLDENNADAHLNLGNALLELKNVKQAIDHYQAALRIRPEFSAAQRGLVKAQNTSDEMRSNYGPFGRLVDENDRSGVVESIRRVLTDDERFADRKAVYEHAVAAERSATELVDYCKKHVDDALSALVKGTAVAGKSTRTLSAAYQQFGEICGSLQLLRQELRRRMLELRAHEELMNSPDLTDLVE